MRAKHIAEYLALRSGVFLFRILPHRLALGVGTCIAAMMHFAFGWRRNVARQRIRQVMGPDLSDIEVNRIAWESFRHLAWNIVEIIKEDQLSDAWFDEHYGSAAGIEKINEVLEQEKGALLVIVHSGNWELTIVHLCRMGIPFCGIARMQKNPLTNRYLNRSRMTSGATIEDRDDPKLIRKLIANLAKGQAVGLLVDLRSRTPVQTSTYLGHEASLGNGLALLASKSGAPVLPIHLVRTGAEQHEWHVGELIQVTDPGDKEMRGRVLQHCLDTFTPLVKQNPECYFWYNKRWVLEPFE